MSDFRITAKTVNAFVNRNLTCLNVAWNSAYAKLFFWIKTFNVKAKKAVKNTKDLLEIPKVR